MAHVASINHNKRIGLQNKRGAKDLRSLVQAIGALSTGNLSTAASRHLAWAQVVKKPLP